VGFTARLSSEIVGAFGLNSLLEMEAKKINRLRPGGFGWFRKDQDARAIALVKLSREG